MINIDAAVLHYGLKDKRHMLELMKSVKPEYFLGQYRELFSVLSAFFANPNIADVVGITAILDYCDRNNLGPKKEALRNAYAEAHQLKPGGNDLQDSEFGYFVSVLKARYNAATVKDSIQRMSSMINAGLDIKDVNALLKDTLQEVNSINRVEALDEGSIGEDIVNIYKEYEAICANPQNFRGVLTGFPSLDALTNGFFGGELIVIGGFAGSGKSLVSMNFAVNAWLGSNDPMADAAEFAGDGKNVVYFSLEMPRSNRGEISSAANLNKRIVSCVGKIPLTDLRRGSLDADKRERLKKAAKFIKKYDREKKLYVIDMPRGATIEDIEMKILELKEKFQIDMVVVDYMGLMEGADDDADHEAQGKIAEGLHELARAYRIPFVTPIQLNRPSGATQSLNKQHYNNTRIARSARIDQNANIILMIKIRDNEKEYPDMLIEITKMRDGAPSDLVFMKDFANMRVYDMLTVESPKEPTNFVDLGAEDDD